MSETSKHPLSSQIEYVSDSFREWWANNKETVLWDDERRGHDRWIAEATLVRTFYELDREHKIQLTAGEKAVELFSFGSNAYDLTTIDRHFGSRYDLRPNESLDIRHVHPQVSNTLYHGRLRALYAGHVLYAHGIGIAEALSEGGNLAIVPKDAEETHSLGN